MTLIRLAKGAKITRSEVSGNKIIGGRANAPLIDAGKNAEILDSLIRDNVNVSARAIRQASVSLARSKKRGEQKGSAIEKALAVMGHVADASAVGGLLGKLWDGISS